LTSPQAARALSPYSIDIGTEVVTVFPLLSVPVKVSSCGPSLALFFTFTSNVTLLQEDSVAALMINFREDVSGGVTVTRSENPPLRPM
jgi:hypothetical protein